MKQNLQKAFMLCMSLVTGLTVFGQQAVKQVDTRISDVTVFQSGAQVSHALAFNFKEGENQLKITDLTVYLDPNSIQVEGTGALTILSVKHEVNYQVDAKTNPRAKALMDSIADVQFKIAEIQAMSEVYAEEQNLLRDNTAIKGTNSNLLPEDLAEMADFYRSRMKEIRFKQLELADNQKNAQTVLHRLQTQLNQLNTRKGTNPSEILLTIIAEKAGNANLKVTYFTQSAGWYPVYDLRAADVNTPITFSYRAKVFQSTGNDWNDVNLTISTGNPNNGSQAPTMYPWYVNIYQPRPRYDVRKGEEVYGYYGAPAPAGAANSDNDQLERESFKSVAIKSNSAQLVNNAVNMEFKIATPYDIPSDNQQYDVTMQTETLKATYEYVTTPKLDNDAFLRAQITDWAQYSLLPGESNIFFKGTYVGKGYIDPALANDTLSLSLGRDKGIAVKREQLKDFCKTGAFGGKQHTTKAYEMTVTNNKKQSISIIIEDQIPISQNGDIEVNVEELSGGVLEENTGKVYWKLTINPGETVKKQIRFDVKYPKKTFVSGL
ncbi:MAG: hypothetical protein RLZZ262_871 [Bacteroidota bacterium]|jgi:uncharacterized protein (TIGR02231 family)